MLHLDMLPRVLEAASGVEQAGKRPWVVAGVAAEAGDIVSLPAGFHDGRVFMKAMRPQARKPPGSKKGQASCKTSWRP
jgi:hypothetical protein